VRDAGVDGGAWSTTRGPFEAVTDSREADHKLDAGYYCPSLPHVQTLGNEKQECPSENQNQRLTPRRLHVDLNPVTAKIADVPETSEYTSVKQRVHHIKVEGRTSQLEAAKAGNVAGSLAATGLEETLWLCPIEDRRRIGSSRVGFERG
jgi:hypothetical protein